MNDDTFTLDDLNTWERSGTWLAVLGHPIKHSLSPHMHNAALEGLAANETSYKQWRYTRFDIPVEELAEALEILHQRKFRGVNLTIPHKVEALNYLKSVDSQARSIGAVNTLLWEDTGYRGFNTDGYGVEIAISRNLGVTVADLPVVLLGAGGAARAAAVQCLDRDCPELWIGNRSATRLEDLVNDLEHLYPQAAIHGFLFEEPPTLPGHALIINATSSGLKDDDPLPLDLSVFSEQSVLFDMIYNPRETICMRAGASAGMRVANGLDMLIYQGARALEIWTGRSSIPEELMRQAAISATA